jgi:hypothetical protein
LIAFPIIPIEARSFPSEVKASCDCGEVIPACKTISGRVDFCDAAGALVAGVGDGAANPISR